MNPKKIVYCAFFIVLFVGCYKHQDEKIISDVSKKEKLHFQSSSKSYPYNKPSYPYKASILLKGKTDCVFTLQLFMDTIPYTSFFFQIGTIDTVITFDWYSNYLNLLYSPSINCSKGNLKIKCIFYH